MSDPVEARKVPDPQNLRIITKINGVKMQDGKTGDMILPVKKIVSELSQGLTLKAGSIILTGTPSGVGKARKPPVYLKNGDIVEIEIPGVGLLKNNVIEE